MPDITLIWSAPRMLDMVSISLSVIPIEKEILWLTMLDMVSISLSVIPIGKDVSIRFLCIIF
jgi:hypothetical protein